MFKYLDRCVNQIEIQKLLWGRNVEKLSLIAGVYFSPHDAGYNGLLCVMEENGLYYTVFGAHCNCSNCRDDFFRDGFIRSEPIKDITTYCFYDDDIKEYFSDIFDEDYIEYVEDVLEWVANSPDRKIRAVVGDNKPIITIRL